MVKLSRLDIVLVDLEPAKSGEIKKIRPCVIVSPNIINYHSRTVIVSAITHYDKEKSKSYLFIPVSANKATGLEKKSLVSTMQIRTIDRVRVIKKLGKLSKSLETSLDYALTLALGTNQKVKKL
jgi:mRNA interferase MazF